jgi:copper transport protein
VALGVLLLAGAGPAAAHATLVSTDPTDGSVVAHAPATISATFDEAVGVSPDSLRVFAPDGTQVDTGGTTVASDPDTVRVALKSGLDDGTYTVAWHVVSADTHPVQGAFTFSVGHRSGRVAAVGLIGSDRFVSTVDAVDRGLGFAGFVVVTGGLVFVGWCWPGGLAVRRTRRVLAAGWMMTVLAAVVQLPVQGLLATERG